LAFSQLFYSLLTATATLSLNYLKHIPAKGLFLIPMQMLSFHSFERDRDPRNKNFLRIESKYGNFAEFSGKHTKFLWHIKRRRHITKGFFRDKKQFSVLKVHHGLENEKLLPLPHI
jgi:hypothetical protein